MPFEPERVVVEAVDDVNWRVVEPFQYSGNQDVFTIERGMETDFASVPRVFVWFLPRYGRYTLAAILHDHLWRNLATHGKLAYVDADGVFRRAMRELGVPFLRRWIMWAAVRWGALVKPGGRERWLSEAPRTVLVTLVALPIIAPAGVVVALASGAFQLVEILAWLPLRFASAARGDRPGRKQVNAPAFEWKA